MTLLVVEHRNFSRNCQLKYMSGYMNKTHFHFPVTVEIIFQFNIFTVVL